jgi:CheY-like chemotaxis protein
MKTHILIVDDNEPDRELLKMLLEFNGYRVTVAGNGIEALAAARSCPPDAIVSDVAMPKMDGFVLCHTWMQDADLKAIPFIFYSANLTLAEDVHVGKVLGAARYLIKPMQQEGFLQELRSVLQQSDGHSRPRT